VVGNSTAVTPHGTSSVPNPTTNIGLDANTALLYSDNAPLASASRGGDAKAVWACVPNRFVPSIPQLLVYFHGNDYFVTAELKNGAAVGRRPDWWTKSTSKVDPVAAVPPKGNKPGRAAIPNGQGACGHYYKFDAIDAVVSSTVTNLPLVLLPEDGMASGQTYPSGTATLEAMVDDCLTGLFKLAKPGGGSNYLTQQLHPKDMRRLFLTGHSGGGGPLYEACSSVFSRISRRRSLRSTRRTSRSSPKSKRFVTWAT